jgi:hypothetical protein
MSGPSCKVDPHHHPISHRVPENNNCRGKQSNRNHNDDIDPSHLRTHPDRERILARDEEPSRYSATTHSSARKHPENFWDVARAKRSAAPTIMDPRSPFPTGRRRNTIYQEDQEVTICSKEDVGDVSRFADSQGVVKISESGFKYRSIAAEFDSPSHEERKKPDQDVRATDGTIKTTKGGFTYRSIAARWDQDQLSKQQAMNERICSNTNQQFRDPGKKSFVDGIDGTMYPKDIKGKENISPREESKKKLGVMDRPYSLGLKPTSELEEIVRRRERAIRFGLLTQPISKAEESRRYRFKPY